MGVRQAPPSFSNSFWTSDYATGLNNLYDKLDQGLVEDDEIIQFIKDRAGAEEQYGNRLVEISKVQQGSNGFQRDDGASLRRAFEGYKKECSEQGEAHRKISANLNELVLKPLIQWSSEHANRVNRSKQELSGYLDLYQRQITEAERNKNFYFNKCRVADDVEEEAKFAPARKMTIEVPKEDVIDIGDRYFKSLELHLFFKKLQKDLPSQDVTVPILGTYHNCYSGDSITLWLMDNHANARMESEAIDIGQELVDKGYLRQVGTVGSRFVNDPSQLYQFKKKAVALDPEALMMSSPSSIMGPAALTANSTIVAAEKLPMIGSFVSQYTNPNNETYPRRLRREAEVADDSYKTAVRKADRNRMFFEEALMDHLKFMEKCEYNRLRALKAVFLSISAAIGNVLPSIQASCDRSLLHQETYNPDGDLRALIDQYKTGPFTPNVPIYENYYHQDGGQTFGIALEQKTRMRVRKVPIIVDLILDKLQKGYEKLESNHEKQNTWIYEVPLTAVHHCRESLNATSDPKLEQIEPYDLPIICSTLKLYLIELPVPLMQYSLWDPLKKLYTRNDTMEVEENDEKGVSFHVEGLTKLIKTLSPAHFVTLDTILAHIAQLVKSTNADDDYVMTLGNVLGPCLIRPKVVNAITLHDKFSNRVVKDLIKNYDTIFGEVRASGVFRDSIITGKSSGEIQQRSPGVESNSSRTLPHLNTESAVLAQPIPQRLSPVRLVDNAYDDSEDTPTQPTYNERTNLIIEENRGSNGRPVSELVENIETRPAHPSEPEDFEPGPIPKFQGNMPSRNDSLHVRPSWKEQENTESQSLGSYEEEQHFQYSQAPRPGSPQHGLDSKRPIGVTLADTPPTELPTTEKKSSLSRRSGVIMRSGGLQRKTGGSLDRGRPGSQGGADSAVAARVRNFEQQKHDS